jgi:Stress responsive A/B Barrel Domain.
MAKQLDYFVHHVYFWLKKPVTHETRLKFENGLKKLVTIQTIVGKNLGTPATTDRGVIDSTYSYSLLLTFKSKEDQDIYQTHPIHLKFIDECEELWERVIVYDSISF